MDTPRCLAAFANTNKWHNYGRRSTGRRSTNAHTCVVTATGTLAAARLLQRAAKDESHTRQVFRARTRWRRRTIFLVLLEVRVLQRTTGERAFETVSRSRAERRRSTPGSSRIAGTRKTMAGWRSQRVMRWAGRTWSRWLRRMLDWAGVEWLMSWSALISLQCGTTLTSHSGARSAILVGPATVHRSAQPDVSDTSHGRLVEVTQLNQWPTHKRGDIPQS